MTTMTLDGKVALVTGGARGIGASICERLSRHGAAVAFTYVQSHDNACALVDSISAGGGRARAVCSDVAEPADVAATIRETLDAFGRIDILVNNAALQLSGAVESYPLDKLDRMLAVNVRGLFLMTQEALRHMSAGARIINVGSISSDYMPVADHAVYAMTKGAVASLTRGLARDLGTRGITVNNVQPGRIATELLMTAIGPLADKIKAGVALQRFGDVSEVAALVAFLAGPDASFITGASLRVDGGASA